MKRNRANYIETSMFLELLEDLGIKQVEAKKMLQIGDTAFCLWKKTNRMPATQYWAFQKSLACFLQEDLIKKLVRIGLVSKEFLQELIDE